MPSMPKPDGTIPRIKNVMAAYNTEYKVVLVATSDGLMVGDVQPLSRLQVTCIAEENGNRQVGTFGGGGRIGLEYFQKDQRYLQFATRSGARSDPQSAVPSMPRPGSCRSCLAGDGLAFCCTKPSGMVSRRTSTARKPRPSPIFSEKEWHRKSARSWMMERFPFAVGR